VRGVKVLRLQQEPLPSATPTMQATCSFSLVRRLLLVLHRDLNMTNTRAPDWSIATHCGSVAPFERVQNSLAPDRTIVRPGQDVRSTSQCDAGYWGYTLSAPCC